MKIPVNLGKQSYDIVLARGAIKTAGDNLNLDRRVLVVTDDGVPAEYAECVAAQCKAPVIVTLPQGEKNKNFSSYQRLLSEMLRNSFSRRDCVVAVGGGVVGDMSGFAAATYMRGIDFYNIPTTLLSQVDSSIGGKVAIDFDGVKNAVGAFYQPREVLIDPVLLSTLDKRQISAGLAESIKMAATCDEKLFEFIENSKSLEDDIDRIIEGSLRIKKYVVENDPTEKDLRRVLNFGHTIGHAVESSMMGELLHGECVALGMLPMCTPEVRVRLRGCLEKYGLPVSVNVDKEALMDFAKHDKKALSDGIITVFTEKIGTFEFRKISVSELYGYLNWDAE